MNRDKLVADAAIAFGKFADEIRIYDDQVKARPHAEHAKAMLCTHVGEAAEAAIKAIRDAARSCGVEVPDV